MDQTFSWPFRFSRYTSGLWLVLRVFGVPNQVIRFSRVPGLVLRVPGICLVLRFSGGFWFFKLFLDFQKDFKHFNVFFNHKYPDISTFSWFQWASGFSWLSCIFLIIPGSPDNSGFSLLFQVLLIIPGSPDYSEFSWLFRVVRIFCVVLIIPDSPGFFRFSWLFRVLMIFQSSLLLY